METLISIFREIRDPRDFTARHDLPAMLFVALAATLCGAKSCVDFADFAAAHEDELAEIVDLGHGAPSHDCFSRLFRLLDPEEMATAFARFAKALREGLGLGPAKGVVAVDGKRLRRGYERGRAFMPPLMVSVWDAETRLSLATRHAPGGDEVAATLAALKSLVLKGCTVTADALHCHPRMATEVRTEDEAPLDFSVPEMAGEYFDNVQHREFWIAGLALFVKYYLCDRVHPGRCRRGRGLAPRGHARTQAAGVRRLPRRRRLAGRPGRHHPRAARHPRRIERRALDGGRDHATTRPVPCRRVRGAIY